MPRRGSNIVALFEEKNAAVGASAYAPARLIKLIISSTNSVGILKKDASLISGIVKKSSSPAAIKCSISVPASF